MNQGDEPDLLLEEAIDWLLRLQDAKHDPALSRQLSLWFEQSDAHEAAWKKAQKVWVLMGHAEPIYENIWLEKNSDRHEAFLKPVPSRSEPIHAAASVWKKVQFAALSGTLAVMLFFAAPILLLRFEADYRTTTGQTETVMLDDGSTLILAADSAVAVDFKKASRNIRLLRGEVYFDVFKDSNRPFIVTAGEAEVSVLGTAFDVKLTDSATAVTLERGVVEVRDRLHLDVQSERLGPGDKVELVNGSERMVRSSVRQEDIAGWRNGYLFVEDVTVSSVIEELQRYHPAWIGVTDQSLGQERVTGLYNLNEPDRALRALVQPYGGTVHSLSPYLRMISRSN